jgi:hypothetical protein
MLGFAGMLSVMVVVRAGSVTEVTVMVSDSGVVTGVGAVYVTPVVVELVSVPHVGPLQPDGFRIQYTPAFFVSPTTVAVKLTESPGSTVTLVPPPIVIAVGITVVPPQPDSVARPSSRRRAGDRRGALRTKRCSEGRRSVGICFPGKLRKAGLEKMMDIAVILRYAPERNLTHVSK